MTQYDTPRALLAIKENGVTVSQFLADHRSKLLPETISDLEKLIEAQAKPASVVTQQESKMPMVIDERIAPANTPDTSVVAKPLPVIVPTAPAAPPAALVVAPVIVVKKQPKWLLDVAARMREADKASEEGIRKVLEERAKKGRGGLAFIPEPEQKYKLWRAPFSHSPEFREHPEEYSVVAQRMDQRQNRRFTALVDAHLEKRGKLPFNVTRWDDAPPPASAFIPREKVVAQGPASLKGRRMSSYSKKKLYWLWENRVPYGHLCTIAGDPDEGKSLITLYIAACVSTGKQLYDNPAETEPAEVLLLSAEDDPESTLRPRLEAVHADVARIHLLESVFLKDGKGNETERIAQLDSDIAMICSYLDLYPEIKLVIIDPISSFLGSANLNREQEVRRVLQPLQKRARESGLAVVMVAHFNKNSETRSAMDRVGGAKAIVGMGRSAWTCIREPQKEQQSGEPTKIEDVDRRLFLKLKNNLAPSKIGGLIYSIKARPIEVEDREGKSVKEDTPYIVWLGTTQDTAQGVVIEGKVKPKVTDAVKEWLRNYLAQSGGCAFSDEVLKVSASLGYSERTVQRARGELKLAFGYTQRRTYWYFKGTAIPDSFLSTADERVQKK